MLFLLVSNKTYIEIKLLISIPLDVEYMRGKNTSYILYQMHTIFCWPKELLRKLCPAMPAIFINRLNSLRSINSTLHILHTHGGCCCCICYACFKRPLSLNAIPFYSLYYFVPSLVGMPPKSPDYSQTLFRTARCSLPTDRRPDWLIFLHGQKSICLLDNYRKRVIRIDLRKSFPFRFFCCSLHLVDRSITKSAIAACIYCGYGAFGWCEIQNKGISFCVYRSTFNKSIFRTTQISKNGRDYFVDRF